MCLQSLPGEPEHIKSITDNGCLFRINLKYLIIYLVCFTFGGFTCVTNKDCTSLCILGWGMFSLCTGDSEVQYYENLLFQEREATGIHLMPVIKF